MEGEPSTLKCQVSPAFHDSPEKAKQEKPFFHIEKLTAAFLLFSNVSKG
jgi:hypothetical protein